MEGRHLLVGDNYGVPTWNKVSGGAYLLVGDNYGVLAWHQVNGGHMIEDVFVFCVEIFSTLPTQFSTLFITLFNAQPNLYVLQIRFLS